MRREIVTSAHNPLLTHLKKLLSSRSYREKCGEFAADGTKLLEEAARWYPELETVVAQQGEELCALPEQQQLALLVKLAVEGSTTGREELVFSAPDRARYGKKVVIAANEALEKAGKTACLTLSELSRDIRGGLYVKNGNIENNCSFEMILRLLREQLAAETAKLLFE